MFSCLYFRGGTVFFLPYLRVDGLQPSSSSFIAYSAGALLCPQCAADARPMFCWPRSASTARSQVWLGLPDGRFQSGGSPRITAATARWSVLSSYSTCSWITWSNCFRCAVAPSVCLLGISDESLWIYVMCSCRSRVLTVDKTGSVYGLWHKARVRQVSAAVSRFTFVA